MKTVYLVATITGYGHFSQPSVIAAFECESCANAQREWIVKDGARADVLTIKVFETIRDAHNHDFPHIKHLTGRGRAPACGHAPLTIQG